MSKKKEDKKTEKAQTTSEVETPKTQEVKAGVLNGTPLDGLFSQINVGKK